MSPVRGTKESYYLTPKYIRETLISPYGAVFAALLAIFVYLALESDDEIAVDGHLNIFLLVLFSCLALLPDSRSTGSVQ